MSTPNPEFKEVIEYLTSVVTGDQVPSEKSFQSHLIRYHALLCGGSDWLPMINPIAELAVKTSPSRLFWILQSTAAAVHQCTEEREGGTGSTEQKEASAHHHRFAEAALFLSETFLRAALKVMKDDVAVLRGQFHRSGVGKTLVGTLLKATVKGGVAVDGSCVLLQLGVIRLLITMCSIVLYHKLCEVDFFSEEIIYSSHLTPLLKLLFSRVALWGKEASGASATGEGLDGPLLSHYGASSAPSSFSLLGYFTSFLSPTAKEHVNPVLMSWCKVVPTVSSREVLYHRSAELLAILVLFRRGFSVSPAQQYVAKLIPVEEEEEKGELLTFAPLPFLEAVAHRVAVCPVLLGVLYVVVSDNPECYHHAIASIHTARVNLAVQQLLYQLLQLTYRIKVCQNIAKRSSPLSSGAPSSKSAPPPPPPAAALSSERVVEADALNLASTVRPLSMSEVEQQLTQNALSTAYFYLDFMIATLLFMLSKDRFTNRIVSVSENNNSSSSSFISSSYRSKLSLGCMAVVTLCVSVTHAMKLECESLATMFAVTLANLSPFLCDIDPGTAQTLLSTIATLLRTVERCAAGEPALTDSPTETTDSATTSTTPHAKRVARGEASLRVLQVMVEAVEGMLVGRSRSSEYLVYELLYSKEKLVVQPRKAVDGETAEIRVACEGLLSDARQALRSIEGLVQNYYADIAVRELEMSVEDVLKLIRQEGIAASDNDANKANDWLLYVYEESTSSYQFFTPFVWSIIACSGGRPGGFCFAQQLTEECRLFS